MKYDQVMRTVRAPAGVAEFALPTPVSAPPAAADWLHEIKFDGYRVQLSVERGQARLRTRHGQDWTQRLPALARVIGQLPDCVIDGELCAVNGDGYSDFAALRSALALEQSGRLVVFAFDALEDAQDGDLRAWPLTARKRRLRTLLARGGRAARMALPYVGEIDVPAHALFQAASVLGLEGIVSKRRDGVYPAGRTQGWVKTKCRPSEEVVIGGWKSDGERFDALLAGVVEDGRLRYAGAVQSGYDAIAIGDLVRRLRRLETGENPFELGEAPRRDGKIRWVRPELVAEIEFAGAAASGRARRASFKGLRLDKTFEDLRGDEQLR